MKKVFLLSLIAFYVQAQTLYFNNYDSLGKNDKVVTNATFEGLATTTMVSEAVSSLVPTNRTITIGSQVGSLGTNLVFASSGSDNVTKVFNPTNASEWTEIRGNERWVYSITSNATYTYTSYRGEVIRNMLPYPIPQTSAVYSSGDVTIYVDYIVAEGAFNFSVYDGEYVGSNVYVSEPLPNTIVLSDSNSGGYIGTLSAEYYLVTNITKYAFVSTNDLVSIQGAINQRVEKSNGTATNLSIFSSLTLLDKTITWNTSRQTFDIPLYGGVVGQLFQENLMLVRNQTGANIGNGKIVCSAGSVGDNSAIRKASNADASCAWGVLGMVTQDTGIDHGSDGLICTGGEVNNLPLPTSVYQPSNTLWLATDGNYTNVEPQNVAVKYQIGTVLRAHATKGRIQFNPQYIPSPASIGAASASNATLTGTATINGDAIIGAGGVTNAVFYKPIVSSVSAITSTVSVVPSVSIYRLTATNSTTITFDTSALNTTNQVATWELWVMNASTNNSIIWPSTNSVYYLANPSSISANSQTVYTVWRKFGDTIQCNPYLVK